MLKRSAGVFFISLIMSLPAHADELTDAAMNLCEKVKVCALAQVAEEDLTPEVRQMMQPMLDNMCTEMQSSLEEVPAGHPHYEPAVACLRSMEELSCEMMQDEQRIKTPECGAYDKLTGGQAGDS